MELRPKWHYSWFCPTSRSLTTPVKVYAMATHLELSFIPFFSYRCVRRALPTLAAGISNRKRPRIEVSRIHQHSIGQLQPRSLLSAINAIASSHRAWEYPAAVVRRGEIQNDEVLCCTLVFDSQVQIQKKNYFQAVLRLSFRYQLCNLPGNVWPDSFHRRSRDRSASSTWSNFPNEYNEFRLTFSLYSQIFCIFMLTLGFCYFLFLIVDIRLHVQRAKKAVKDKENRIKMFEEHLARTEVINWLRKL